MQEATRLLEQQREFFASNTTKSIPFRIEQLKNLKKMLVTHESDILLALQMDLNKSFSESMMSEVLLILKEIDYAIKHLKQWSRPKKVKTPLLLFPGKSYIHTEPYGCTLIMSPWNYPIMLSFSPLIGAISAGNCAILKPSEVAPYTQHVIVELISKWFDPRHITALNLDATQTEQLLENQFDYIFFTGSTHIGKKIMSAAAKHLTPVTLELGGKSPCIVDETADLDFAARRIIWAKMLNAGQTCIAPDYLYVQQSCKEELVEKLRSVLQDFYGSDPERSTSFGRIINQKHLERLSHLLKAGNIIQGGKVDVETQYIAPTLIDNISWQDPIMQEEIFGPILPILTFDKIEILIANLKMQAKPLALYLFSSNQQTQQLVTDELSFGGGCINDCIMQVANHYLPFGGVGMSGMGGYHGEHSFQAFSHGKSIYRKSWLLDAKLEYPPFSEKKLRWVKWLFSI
ncbi:MAG: aldehyde dehydrogenase [Gammaproteobacteria bacterium]